MAQKTWLLDSKQPLVFKVGHLGPDYWTWVSQVEVGQPRFFKSEFAERCSKVVWWVVPAIWLPVAFYSTFQALATHKLDAPSLTSLLAAGVLVWQLLEYLIHRFLFHATSDTYWGITLHFLFHGCHHKYPMDHERLVFPPVPATPVVCLVHYTAHALLPVAQAKALFAGIIFAYVFYDCVHYTMHHGGKMPGPVLKELKSRHMHHHFHDHDKGYGISSMLYDWLLGTLADKQTKRARKVE
jgi:dihydroceramide fatty acyl 2-hydroxylase